MSEFNYVGKWGINAIDELFDGNVSINDITGDIILQIIIDNDHKHMVGPFISDANNIDIVYGEMLGGGGITLTNCMVVNRHRSLNLIVL